MENEAKVLSLLGEAFPSVDTTQAVTAVRRIYLSVTQDVIFDMLRYAKETMSFGCLCAITGLDTGEGYEFLYHISDDKGMLLTLKYRTADGDGVVIPSVLPIYEGATFYELELEGLLGVKVDGLPQDRQYPLPDNWPAGEYPMRKSWESKAKQEQE